MQRGFGYQNRRNAALFSPLSLFPAGVNGAWYDPSDSTTLFSDRAGTTPCGTPGGGSVVPVGAMLDKRATAYSVFFDGTGDYLTLTGTAIGSGDFTVEGWVYPTAAGSQIYFDCRASDADANGFAFYRAGTSFSIFTNGAATSGGTVSNNVWTHLAFVRSAGTITAYINGTQAFTLATSANFSRTAQVIGAAWNFAGPVTGYMSNVRVVVGTAVYTGAFTPPTAPLSPITGTSLLTCGTSWTGNPAITKNGDARVDGLNPFQASPVGNHAIAANDTTARPELSARVNLITNSENFAGTGWSGTATIATDVTTAPNGTTTADSITAAATSANQYIRRSPAGLLVNVQFAWSVAAKKNTSDWLYLRFWDTSNAGIGNAVWFNVANGTVGSSTAGTVGSITNLGDGWYRCTVTRTIGGSIAFNEIDIAVSNADNTINATAGNSVFVWGADLRPTNIGSTIPAYQRISDANTYDAVGFPRYFVANGTSSAMSTPGNVNLSGTDKVTVFAGVRKLSAGLGFVAELSANTSTNNGSFYVVANNGANDYGVSLRGTAQATYQPVTYTAPISNVLAVSYDIAGAGIADEIVPRVNGVVEQENPSGANAGTGNFGTYPLFIGARNNASSFLTGNIYSIIVVGSAVSAGQISATEQWVAGKVGITI